MMKANAGGYIAPEQVVGRDKFISNTWRLLEQQSLVLTSERRIGKSSILRKMADNSPENTTIVSRDVEGVSTVKEFITRLIDDLSSHQKLTTKASSLIGTIRKELSDFKILGVTISKKSEPDWIALLEDMIKRLADLYLHEDKTLIMMWDEFPWMLQKIIKNEGHASAANLLDNLRLARQNHGCIRMVFTGSIGLHHVLKELKAEHLANEPVNDMKVINLPPLQLEDAKSLTEQLVEGENLTTTNEMFFEQLSSSVDCVPYYIHHLISSFVINETTLNSESISKEINAAFVNANDPWNLRHYDDRLKDYYGEHYIFYQHVLDIIAQEQEVTLDELQNLLQSSVSFSANEQLMGLLKQENFLLEALRLLMADHYLIKNPENNSYDFSFALIKKWWSTHRT